MLQFEHAPQPPDPEELAAGVPEGRCPRVHHVPASHHELPGEPLLLPSPTGPLINTCTLLGARIQLVPRLVYCDTSLFRLLVCVCV